MRLLNFIISTPSQSIPLLATILGLFILLKYAKWETDKQYKEFMKSGDFFLGDMCLGEKVLDSIDEPTTYVLGFLISTTENGDYAILEDKDKNLHQVYVKGLKKANQD
jgi:hypothetical protein